MRYLKMIYFYVDFMAFNASYVHFCSCQNIDFNRFIFEASLQVGENSKYVFFVYITLDE